MSFEWPLALIGLASVPLLVALYVVRDRRRTAAAARLTSPGLLPNLVDASPGWRRHLPIAVLVAALTAMLVGVARPHATVSVKREEATVILVLDTSLSMRADDVKPTRLLAARGAARAFVEQMPKKFRVGLVGFAGRAYVALPPTNDRSLVPAALTSLRPGQGTSLGDAVALATQLGRRQRAADGVVPPISILVISDGAQKSGRTQPAAAAQSARSGGIPVYAVLLGTPNGVIQVPLANGYQAQIRVPPDAETLRTVTGITGGELFTAPTDARLRDVYEKLGSRLGRRTQVREVTDYFAGGSAALLFVGGALSALWFRRVP
ncbi:MAG TPA: VWA domain-containing protein [Gaiellaceae bacterium]